MIIKHLTQLIGNTPMLKLENFCNHLNITANIYAKLEFFNPLCSVKDRTAYAMITEAEKSGLIGNNATIIESTSGNTGIALAYICAEKNYKLILTMPENVSSERIKLLELLGAQVVLTDAEKGMSGAVARAREIHSQTNNSVILDQFSNLSNRQIHYQTTAKEILDDIKDIDIFVAGVGTGGTFSGIAAALKQQNPKMQAVAVEPSDSAFLSQNKVGQHKILGIGAGFLPDNLDKQLIDQIITVDFNEALEGVKLLAKTHGLTAGISSGAAAMAAVRLAKGQKQPLNIVTVFASSVERELSVLV